MHVFIPTAYNDEQFKDDNIEKGLETEPTKHVILNTKLGQGVPGVCCVGPYGYNNSNNLYAINTFVYKKP